MSYIQIWLIVIFHWHHSKYSHFRTTGEKLEVSKGNNTGNINDAMQIDCDNWHYIGGLQSENLNNFLIDDNDAAQQIFHGMMEPVILEDEDTPMIHQEDHMYSMTDTVA